MKFFKNLLPKSKDSQLKDILKSSMLNGGSGIIIQGNEVYKVKKLCLTEPGFAVFETTCGHYMKISGDYHFITISKNA